MPPKRSCIVCDSSASYKCPTCISPYCSSKCFQSHKVATCTPKPVAQPPKSEPPPFEYATLSKKQQAILDNSVTIQERTQSHIKSLCTHILSSHNPLSQLQSTFLHNPEFRDFYLEIVDLIGQEAEGHLDLSKPQESSDEESSCSNSLIPY
ncbi:hypothetical protein GEMRC1_002390 [Eukaryota sp. GEM-RC1]